MVDDDLLRRLAETARQEDDEETRELDRRWDALAAGTLPEAEAEALRAEAGESMEGRMAYERFAPLDDAFRSRMVEVVRKQVSKASPAVPRPIIASPRRRRVWLAGSAAAAALAACLLVLVVQPGREPLPLYTARLTGGTEELRSREGRAGKGSPQVLVPGNSFEILLSPQDEVAGRLAAATFVARGGEVSPWPVPWETSEHGAVRIAGQVGQEIQLPAGESALLVAVGRPEALPAAGELEGRQDPGCRPLGRDATVCVVPVIFRPEP